MMLHAYRIHSRSCIPEWCYTQHNFWSKIILVTEPLDSDLRSIILKLGSFHTILVTYNGCIRLAGIAGVDLYFQCSSSHDNWQSCCSSSSKPLYCRCFKCFDFTSSFDVIIPRIGDETFTFQKPIYLHKLQSCTTIWLKYLYLQMRSAKMMELSNSKKSFAEKKEYLESSRIAKLWLQYMDMIDILHRYIQAEHTGSWELHLQTLSEIFPFLAASGHYNCIKSVWIYLQKMSHLQENHPSI